MKKGMAMGALIITFSGSTLLGSIIGVLALKLLERAGIAKLKRNGI
jgi:predicted membrane protein